MAKKKETKKEFNCGLCFEHIIIEGKDYCALRLKDVLNPCDSGLCENVKECDFCRGGK